MRHHAQTIIGVHYGDPTEPKPYQQPTRSTVDQLGELAERIYFESSVEGETLWLHIAQAVRLAELAEPFTDDDHYEASKVFASTGYMAASGSILKAALSAALASRVARARKEKP